MTDFAELAKTEKDPVRRAHFLKMAAGPDALKELTHRDTTKQDKRAKIVEEVARLGRANRAAMQEQSAQGERPTLNAGHSMSENDLRDAIEAATGERPHHRTGRARLLDDYNKIK